MSMPVASKENAEHYLWGDGCDGWHLAKSGNLSVIMEHVPGGRSETRHFHKEAEQFFFVLYGKATLEVGGEILTVFPNQGIHVSAGLPHQLRNEQSEDLKFLVISTPPSHGDRIEVD